MKLQEKNEAACFFPLCPTFQTTPDSNRLGLHCSLLSLAELVRSPHFPLCVGYPGRLKLHFISFYLNHTYLLISFFALRVRRTRGVPCPHLL